MALALALLSSLGGPPEDSEAGAEAGPARSPASWASVLPGGTRSPLAAEARARLGALLASGAAWPHGGRAAAEVDAGEAAGAGRGEGRRWVDEAVARGRALSAEEALELVAQRHKHLSYAGGKRQYSGAGADPD